ncbi:MAG: TonB-dependent receptor plug domain-containing protein [Panacagrimonas sp.]
MTLSIEEAMRRAAQGAMLAGTGVAVAVSGPALGQDADKPAGKSVELDKVQVTGSRIRRVDTETASPIFTIDRATIEATGVTTLGDLVQELPSISGAATNPRVNNGGGTGAAVVSLRGLNEQRTLVLLNGRRLTAVTNGISEGVDINAIPINLIEKVEVLKEGASAIYGSDAIGGVVNFITRKGYTGLELSYDAGVTSEDDGDRQSVNLSWGFNTDKGNVTMGLNYNDQEGISAGDRDFAKDALYLYGGVVSAAGSSRTPTGRLFFAPGGALATQFGCGSVTRNVDAVGDSFDDYHCFTGADTFNYQPFNLILTPQERVGLFTVANYQIADKVEGYAELFYNNTKSGFQIAPLPFDTRPDNVVISGDNVYNPFGTDFGGVDAVNPNATFRLLGLGNRRSESETNNGQINLGIRGDLPLISGWRYDASLSQGRTEESTDTFGYLFTPGIRAALGPSFDAADNDPSNGIQDPTCGTPGNPIANCTPLNIFNLPSALADPAQAAQFAAANASYGINRTRDLKIANLNFNGTLFQLPAGAAQLALGFEYREQTLSNDVDFLARGTGETQLLCQLAEETCTNPTEGELRAREYYGELFLPLLSGKPFVEQLNVILGGRYSDYSRFGSSTNLKGAIEYRPMQELLVRASYAEVFRAPTITDLFLNVTANAATFTDPCTGLTQAALDAPDFLELVCQNVVPDGAFIPDNGQVTGRFRGNTDLEPEDGDVLTYGFVYDPNFLKGLSVTVDFWQYQLDDTIEPLDVNTTATLCRQTGADTFCGLINRGPEGQVKFIDQPIFNLGEIDTSGVDLGFKYRVPTTRFGKIRLGLDSTYTEEFERTVLNQKIEVDGTFDRQDGNFARWRGLGSVDWDIGDFETLLTWRYVHGFKVKDADGNPVPDTDGDGAPEQITLNIGSHSYFNASVQYTLPAFKSKSGESTKSEYRTKLLVGVDNIGDKQPPILYQNNVTNGNTDVETFDTIGRFFFARITQNF